MDRQTGEWSARVQTADCMPVLFHSADAKIVAAAHAGWRGLSSGILENTVAEMRRQTDAAIVAHIGPCISAPNYPVGGEVRESPMRRRRRQSRLHRRQRGGQMACGPARIGLPSPKALRRPASAYARRVHPWRPPPASSRPDGTGKPDGKRPSSTLARRIKKIRATTAARIGGMKNRS